MSQFLGGNKLSWNNSAKITMKCSLHYLNLRGCGLVGEVPSSPSTQEDLKFLDLSKNQLTEGISQWLADAAAINHLIISDNELTGPIPPSLFDSENLLMVDLSRNNLSGEQPKNVGNADGVIILLLSNNNLSGPLPQSMANMSELVAMDLSKNRFSGNTFPKFNQCTYLTYIDFSGNNFSGQIAVNFSLQIRTLSLGPNKFTGRLPENLTSMQSSLEHLDLHDNYITGVPQESLATISRLQVLNLRNNRLEGSIPRALCNLSMLHILDLSGNNFGHITPIELGRLNRIFQTPIAYVTVPKVFVFIQAFYLPVNSYCLMWDDLNLRNIIASWMDLTDTIVNWKGSLPSLE